MVVLHSHFRTSENFSFKSESSGRNDGITGELVDVTEHSQKSALQNFYIVILGLLRISHLKSSSGGDTMATMMRLR